MSIELQLLGEKTALKKGSPRCHLGLSLRRLREALSKLLPASNIDQDFFAVGSGNNRQSPSGPR